MMPLKESPVRRVTEKFNKEYLEDSLSDVDFDFSDDEEEELMMPLEESPPVRRTTKKFDKDYLDESMDSINSLSDIDDEDEDEDLILI